MSSNKKVTFSLIIALIFFTVGATFIFIFLNQEKAEKTFTVESIELLTDSLVKIRLQNDKELPLENLHFVFVNSFGREFFYNQKPFPDKTAEYFIDASTIPGLTNFLEIKKIYIEYSSEGKKIDTKPVEFDYSLKNNTTENNEIKNDKEGLREDSGLGIDINNTREERCREGVCTLISVCANKYYKGYDCTIGALSDDGKVVDCNDDDLSVYPNTSDAQNCIQNALNSYKTVRLSKGTFFISGSLTVPEGVTLVGEGKETKIVTTKNVGRDIFFINKSNIVLSNFSLISAYYPDNGITISLESEDISNISVRNLYLSISGQYALLLTSNLKGFPTPNSFIAQNISIVNNDIVNFNEIGIEIFPRVFPALNRNSRGLTILNNRIFADNGINRYSGIKVNNFHDVIIKNNSLSGGLYSTGAIDIVQGTKNVLISSNYLDTTNTGITLSFTELWGMEYSWPSARNVTIQDNNLLTMASYGILLTGGAIENWTCNTNDWSCDEGDFIIIEKNNFINSEIKGSCVIANGRDIFTVFLKKNVFSGNGVYNLCVSNSVIEENKITDGKNLYILGNNNTIKDNILERSLRIVAACRTGFICNNNRIEHNTLTESNDGSFAISLLLSGHSKILNNFVTAKNKISKWGISCAHSEDADIRDNIFEGNFTIKTIYTFNCTNA